MSTTVTVWIAVAWLPGMSVAVQVTLVEPTKNFGGALLVNVTRPPQSSTAAGSPRSVPLQSFKWMSGGTKVKTGGVVSTIVTVCDACTTGSTPSSPLHVTALAPRTNG